MYITFNSKTHINIYNKKIKLGDNGTLKRAR